MMGVLSRAFVEGMTDMSGSNRELYKEVISSLLALVIAVLIVAFVGKWLWNNSMVELFTIARPVRSVWHIIALMLFLSLMR